MTRPLFEKLSPGDWVVFQNSSHMNGQAVHVIEKSGDDIIYEHPKLYCRCAHHYTKFKILAI